MALPNPGSIGYACFRGAWFPLDPPRHLFLPRQSALVALCRAAGFEGVRLLRRGRSGPSGFRESAARARQLGRPPHGAAALRLLSNAVATMTPRWAEETVLVATRPIT